MTNAVDPRSITDAERPFLDALKTLADARALQRRIVDELGEAPREAAGLVLWLAAKQAGDPDPTSAPTRSRYRKLLRQLVELDKPKGRRRRAAEAGYAELAPVMGIAAGAAASAVALAISGPAAASIGAPVALYVTRTPGAGELQAAA